MLIIGCDYHPSVQQIDGVDRETGECVEKRLMHSDGEAENFYRELKQKGVQVRVGIEATGHSRWFERLLAELGFELWRPGRDSGQARPKAEERPTRCGTHSQTTGGRSLSQSLEAESRESRRTATALAPASVSRDANTSHEPVACYRHERRAAKEEGTVGGPRPFGVVSTGSLVESTPARALGIAGSS